MPRRPIVKFLKSHFSLVSAYSAIANYDNLLTVINTPCPEKSSFLSTTFNKVIFHMNHPGNSSYLENRKFISKL